MGWTGIKDYGFGGKNRTREEDDEYRSRIKGVPKKRTWTKERCIGELEDILDILKKVLREDDKIEVGDKRKLKNETIRDVTTLMNKILDYMRYLYPPVQENVNVNIDLTANTVIERLKKWKEDNTIFEVGEKNE
jgi:hypothetical protein